MINANLHAIINRFKKHPEVFSFAGKIFPVMSVGICTTLKWVNRYRIYNTAGDFVICQMTGGARSAAHREKISQRSNWW